MSLTTLKHWRLIVPGILLVVILLLSIQESFSDLSGALKAFSDFQWYDRIIVGVVIIFGALYHILDIRMKFWNPDYRRVQDNIKSTLIEPFSQQLSTEQKDFLKEEDRLTNIFWRFVDKDNSLLEKAKRVRFNGLIWSSAVDIMIISAVGSIILFVKLAVEKNPYSLWMAIILLAASLMSLGLLRRTTQRQLSLSNEQLKFICQFYKQELEESIYAELQNS